MSIENNQQDFERALRDMKDQIETLSTVLDSGIISDLENVVSEYEGHLSEDIEELISENKDLTDEVDRLEDTVARLLDEQDSLHSIIDDISS